MQTGPAAMPATGPVIGIDLGLTHFAVLSDGRKIASPADRKQSPTREQKPATLGSLAARDAGDLPKLRRVA